MVNVRRANEVTGRNPVIQWPHPYDWCSADEQDVACVDGFCIRDKHQRVTLRMSWTYFNEFNLSSTDFKRVTTSKCLRGQNRLDAIKFELTKKMPEQIAHLTRSLIQCSEHGRRHFTHFMCSSCRRNDFRTLKELIAVTMITICMCIDHRVNSC